jgi:hypothetical protein
MFWVRLDAIRPLLDLATTDFPKEPIPKDGTLAHALERAFCVLPELTGRATFECDGSTIAARPALAEPVPQWYRDAVRATWEAERRAAGPNPPGDDSPAASGGDVQRVG